MIKVSQLWSYPLKSGKGLSLQQARFDAEGMLNDRRVLAVDENGLFLTARRYPQLLQLACAPEESGWLLSHPEAGDCVVNAGEATLSGKVWKDDIQALDGGDAAANWLSGVLGIKSRVALWQTASRRSGKYDLETSFADAAPILLTSEASIERACELGGVKPDVRRFRPNIVISGVDAFAEDEWRGVSINGVEFEFLDGCTRCILTTRDPDSGESHPDKQPMMALRQHHANKDGEPLLGMNTALRSAPETSAISVGDTVELLT
ncbi:MAG: MOSC domain-containing protein [Thiolinea sp.]